MNAGLFAGIPSSGLSKGRLRFQEFLTTRTFTPTARFLASGARAWVLLVGGGGGGGILSFANGAGNGGGVILKPLVIATPVLVTIGAGGAINAVGGTSTFGSLLTALGGEISPASARQGGGVGGYQDIITDSVGVSWTITEAPSRGDYGFGMGGGFSSFIAAGAPVANTGNGGDAFTAGYSGYCLVYWYE